MKQITEGIVGIGVDDREIDLFEGQYPCRTACLTILT